MGGGGTTVPSQLVSGIRLGHQVVKDGTSEGIQDEEILDIRVRRLETDRQQAYFTVPVAASFQYINIRSSTGSKSYINGENSRTLPTEQ